jgi:formate dehydrogenase subunit gamma
MPDIQNSDHVRAAFDAVGDIEGALLPVLHEVQARCGYIPADTVPLIADRLNLTRAEVHGVISHYHHFRDAPAGKVVVQVCRAEACQAVGAEQLAAHAVKSLGCDFHETSKDGSVTLEPVYCLGHCACGPSIMVGEDVHARVTPARFDQLIQRAGSTA